MAEASQKSGMAKLVGGALNFFKDFDTVVIQSSAVLFTTFLTNFSANVPICNIVVPILQEMVLIFIIPLPNIKGLLMNLFFTLFLFPSKAVSIKMNPIMLVFPAGIACSMAFHLPVGTPPNAIIAAYANIKTKYMVSSIRHNYIN